MGGQCRSAGWDRLWRGVGAALEAIIWGWDMLEMYVAAVFLIPFCMITSLRVLGVATVWSDFRNCRLEHTWFRLIVLGAPVWLALTLYARFGRTAWAIAFRDWLPRWKWAVICATCTRLGVFAMLGLMFAT